MTTIKINAMKDEPFEHLLTRATNAMEYLERKYARIGYMYMSEVFEALEVSWDPFWRNDCFVYDDDEFDYYIIPVDEVNRVYVVIAD